MSSTAADTGFSLICSLALLLFRFERRTPCCKTSQLFVRPVIIAFALIQLCNLCHFFFCQPEIHDVQIVLNVIDILVLFRIPCGLNQSVCRKPLLYAAACIGCFTSDDRQTTSYIRTRAGPLDIPFAAAHATAFVRAERKDRLA